MSGKVAAAQCVASQSEVPSNAGRHCAGQSAQQKSLDSRAVALKVLRNDGKTYIQKAVLPAEQKKKEQEAAREWVKSL